MAYKAWGAVELLGGVDGTLDNIDGDFLTVGDIAFVITSSKSYFYELDNSGDAASSPSVIAPVSNAGSKRWKQRDPYSSSGLFELTDPNADRIYFWDDSAGVAAWLVANNGLSITGTNLNVNVDDSSIEINSDTLRIKADGIKDTHIDWGTGAGQVSALDVPIADAGSYFSTDNVEAALQESGAGILAIEHSGWENRYGIALASDGGNPPTITITPTGTQYYWSDGVRYNISSNQGIQLTDTSGTHVIYYDGAVLTKTVDPSSSDIDVIIRTKCLVCIVYWNTNNNTTPILANELHETIMDGVTHAYLHTIEGARWVDGAAISGYSLLTGTDAAITFELTNTALADEDLYHPVIDGAPATQYSQQLNGGDAEIPVLYRDATDQSWTEQAASIYPYLFGVNDRPQYMDAASSYALTEVGNNQYCNYWLILTNDWQYPVKMVPGTTVYTNTQDAIQNAEQELIDLGTLPSPEITVLYRLLLRGASGSGTYDCQIYEITDYRGSSFAGGTASQANDHGTLSGLSDDDHTLYLLANGTRSLTGNWDNTGFDITATNFKLPQSGALELGNTPDAYLYAGNLGNIYFDLGAGDDFYIKTNNGTEVGFVVKDGGAVELYHDNIKVFETKADGIKVSDDAFATTTGQFKSITGTTTLSSDEVGSALQLLCNQGNIYLQHYTGAVAEDALVANYNSSVDLYYNNLKAAETAATGFNIYDTSGDAAQLRLLSSASVEQCRLQTASNDVYLDAMVDGGDVYIRTNVSTSAETAIKCVDDGAVALYYNNASVIETRASGMLLANTGNSYIYNNLGERIMAGVPNGAAYLYYNDTQTLFTHAAGINCKDPTANNPKIQFMDSSDTRHGQIVSAGDDMYFDNDIIGRDLYFRVTNASSVKENAIVANEGSAVWLYYDGTKKFVTNGVGCQIGDGSNWVNIFQASADTKIRAEALGGGVALQGTTSGSAVNVLFSGDPAGASELYYAGTKKCETSSTGFNPSADSTDQLGTNILCWSNIYGDAGVTSCSDEKYKQDIGPLPLGLDFINSLVPLEYKFRKTGKRPKNHDRWYWGVLAQDVDVAVGEVGYTKDYAAVTITPDEDGDEWYSLKYEQLIAPMIKAIQEQQEIIEELKLRIEELELGE
jgi:hypothetical protein